ncbi:MAG: GAF domain-containing sensor histidine kinase, partial [Dehalococcoidia bacterium]
GDLSVFLTSGISEEERVRAGPPPRAHGLLGAILHGSASLRVDRIVEHPLAAGLPPHHPRMTNFLGAPIILHGRNHGNLYLADKQRADSFSDADERLLLILAAHAAIAIDNARLYEQTSEALTQRVRELAEANAQLQRLTSLVINAQEEERRRLSRDLHDDTAQALTSILVRMRLLARQAVKDEVRHGLLDLLDLTTQALDDVRRMALDLRPSTLDDLGLVPAVESYAREFAERWGIDVRVSAVVGKRLARDRELIVYRIVQEALANIAKHAGATRVAIDFRREHDHLAVTVHDDGRGFDVAATLTMRERGLGLFGMQERAQLAGGYLNLRSAPGAGTTVTLVVPLRDDGEDQP